MEHLTGMFTFALWDPARGELLLARDPIGEKPLYWAVRGGRLVFGSEIKALLAHPAVTAEVNGDAVAPYLANLVSVRPETLFGASASSSPARSPAAPLGLELRRFRRSPSPAAGRTTLRPRRRQRSAGCSTSRSTPG